MLTLFKSLVQCKLDYCSQLWSPTSKGEINNIEMVQRNFLRKIANVGHLPYWDQLKKLRLYSQERRRERYMIIYIWRILEGQVPNISDSDRGVIKPKISHRLGRKCDIPCIKTNCTKQTQNLREASLCVRGQKLFNTLPKHLRDMKGCTEETFKNALDKYLSTVTDEPHIQGYVHLRRADSYSLLDMTRFSLSKTARVDVATTSARRGCASDVASAQ